MSFCKHCVSGVVHEGTPRGTIEHLNGVETYVGTPSGDYLKDKAILFLSDVFGIPLVNNQLLVDSFADNGFYTVCPDLFNGDTVPVEALERGEFDLRGWFWAGHQNEQTRPNIDKVVSYLKEEKGITKFAAIGYCFGARYVFNLAFEGALEVSIVAHPSMLQAPKDLQEYFDKATAPLLLQTCPIDGQFPHSKQEIADQIFGDGKFEPGYKRDYYAGEGVVHGFAVRGDMNNPNVRRAKEESFKSAVEWLKKYF